MAKNLFADSWGKKNIFHANHSETLVFPNMNICKWMFKYVGTSTLISYINTTFYCIDVLETRLFALDEGALGCGALCDVAVRRCHA